MKKSLVLVFAFSIVTAGVISAQGWSIFNNHRNDPDGLSARISVPSNFREVTPLVSNGADIMLNGRFTSPDGSATFAVTSKNTRFYDQNVDARKISVPLRNGEKVVDRDIEKRNVAVDGYPSYLSYGEHLTISGPGYTRYVKLELRTGSLPGCHTVLWEFTVTSDAAMKQYHSLYKKFKASYDPGEI